MAVELAGRWVHWQPDSALTRWFKARVGDSKGRIRRIAIVARARKLMAALWRYLKDRRRPRRRRALVEPLTGRHVAGGRDKG